MHVQPKACPQMHAITHLPHRMAAAIFVGSLAMYVYSFQLCEGDLCA